MGKVRDIYVCKGYLVLVATDRLSAFDRQLAAIPLEGTGVEFDELVVKGPEHRSEPYSRVASSQC